MKNSKTIFIISVFIFFYWALGKSINVYQYALVGAIFEMLWLPSIIAAILVLVYAIINWYIEKFKWRSYSLMSVVMIGLTVLSMMILHR